MSERLAAAVRDRCVGSATQKWTLHAFAVLADDASGLVTAPVEAVARVCEFQPDSVRRTALQLRQRGLLATAHKVGQRPLYRVVEAAVAALPAVVLGDLLVQVPLPIGLLGDLRDQQGDPSSQLGGTTDQLGDPTDQQGDPLSQLAPQGDLRDQLGGTTDQLGDPRDQQGDPSSQLGTNSAGVEPPLTLLRTYDPDNAREALSLEALQRQAAGVYRPGQGPGVAALQYALEEWPAEWVERAIRMTALRSVGNWNYTLAILKDWRRKGGPDVAPAEGGEHDDRGTAGAGAKRPAPAARSNHGDAADGARVPGAERNPAPVSPFAGIGRR